VAGPETATATAPKGGDPDRYNSASWTTMSQASDLPPRIAALGEDLISVVIKELPNNKSSVNAMTFEEFKLRVKEAVVASPDVGIVSSQVGQSQASKSLAGASMLPQVTGTADTGRRNAGRDPYIDGSKSYDRRGSNFGFSISQLVFDFGSALSGVRAGEARMLAQQELLNSKKSEHALKTISAFVELERAKAQLKLARQNANSRLSVVKLVKERSELGGGTKADIVRVESKYAEALSNISLMETRLSNAEAAYREAFGVTARDIVNGPVHEFAIEGLNTNAEELANAYPGLQQLARLRDASLEDYKSVSAKALPSLQLAYSNNINGVNGPTIPADSPSRSSSMVLQLKYEFYTGGADTARKTEAMYKSQQAWEEFQSGMRQYQKVLSQSQAEIRNNEDLIAARKASANSAIDSMRAVREQFSFNRGSLLDLITVQEGLYQSGRDLIDASADRILVRYRLLHLTAQLDKMFDLGTLVSMNAKD
jgi:outer membrane protein TolC